MKIVDKISVKELMQLSEKMYGGIVKFDVDLAKRIVIVDMEMHADGEATLLEDGSKQSDLWGLNVIPENYGTPNFIEYDSMINIKPRQNNMSRTIQDPEIKKQIETLVTEVVYE